MKEDSIMILVPHEDDEILMAAGIIHRCVLEHKRVTVVMATNGDYGSQDGKKGRLRLRETLESLSVLGLSEKQVEFLGYADTGMEKEKSFLWKLYQEKDIDRLHPSFCSDHTYGLAEKEDFHKKAFGQAAPYTRRAFLTDLCLVLEKYRPEAVFTTCEADTHGDHSGLFLFLKEALELLGEKTGYAPQVYAGVVHSPEGDGTWPVRSEKPDFFTCPKGLEDWGLCWEKRKSFPVPEDMEVEELAKNKKYQALSLHKTALEPDAVEFLYSFIKKEEIFFRV